MRIGIQTWGTEGDVRPLLALGAALHQRGHTVRMLYTNIEARDHGGIARACGVEATAVGAAYFEEKREWLAVRAREAFEDWSPLRQVRAIIEDLIDPVAEPMVDAGIEQAEQSDVVITHFMAYPAQVAAEKSGRPHVVVGLVPMIPSGDYPPIGMPALGLRALHRLEWRIAMRFFDGTFRPRVNTLRARAGMPPLDALRGPLDRATLALVAVSPSLLPRPRDWPERAHVSGSLTLPDTSEPWQPDPSLAAFLAAGPPPAYLSFGSMMNLDADRTAKVVDTLAEAVALAGTRGIIQAPEPILARMRPRAEIHPLVRAPHAKLFPLCSVIVHHGGAGTTQSALLAGRPSIVVPHAADQFYWGALLQSRGAGTKPLRATSLNAPKLAARLRDVQAHPEMAVRSSELGAAIAAEDGASNAADLIERATTGG